MDRIYPMDVDLCDRLRKLMAVDPWLTTALIIVMTPEQWKMLRTQRVFQMLQRWLEREANRSHKAKPQSSNSPADLAQQVLSRIAEKDWLRRFVQSKGTPGGYFNGVCRYQLQDVARSALRQKNRPGSPLVHDIQDERVVDLPDAMDDAEQLSCLPALLARLSAEQRQVIAAAFPGLEALKDHPVPDRTLGLRNPAVKAALATLRAMWNERV